MTNQINGGTEKQIEFATSIANAWRKEITAEIEQVSMRNDESLAWYSEKLEAVLVKFDNAISQVGAVKIIEMKNAGINPAKAMVKQSQQK